jgi:hypothetical protein
MSVSPNSVAVPSQSKSLDTSVVTTSAGLVHRQVVSLADPENPDQYVRVTGNALNVSVSNADGLPVTAEELPLPTGAATENTALSTTAATQESAGHLSAIVDRTPTLGQKNAAGSVPVVLASDQASVPVTVGNFPATQQISGFVSVDNFPATQPISGTVNLGTIGTAATSALQTTGNTSIASIDTKTPTVGQKASAASSPVVLASDQSPIMTMTADESINCYLTSFILAPTTLTTGSVYFAMRNSSATKNIRVRQMRILQQFSGTAAASRSNFAIHPYSHNAAPTGGTVVPTDIIPANPLNATASELNLRASNVAGIVIGGTLDPRKILFGSTNQLTMSNEFVVQAADSPLTMPPTAGFTVRAEGAIVAGTTLQIFMIWDEVNV